MKVQQIFAAIFVLGNLSGVFPIVGQAGVYRPHQYEQWLLSITQNPNSHILSASLFWFGAAAGVMLGLWFCKTGRWWIGSLLGLASLWNWLWTPVPLLLALGLGPDGGQLALGMSLLADAIFNGLLGTAMLLLGWELKETFPKMGYAAVGIGSGTIFVMGQFYFEACADLLGIFGPLWLIWWGVWSWYSAKEPEYF